LSAIVRRLFSERMHKILDNPSTIKQNQLIFLGKVIETINSALTSQQIDSAGLQKIILGISLEEIAVDTDEVKSIRTNLLEFLERGDESIQYLVFKLDDYQARYFAASFLGWFGNNANSAIPQLIDLASGHSSAAGAAQKSILFIGGAEQKILTAIGEALKLEDDESFGNLSNLALKTTLNSSEVFFETLLLGAANENLHIRESVADVIGRLQVSDTEKFKSILVSLLSDKSKVVRDAALTTLNSL
jgi:hypothetical protein